MVTSTVHNIQCSLNKLFTDSERRRQKNLKTVVAQQSTPYQERMAANFNPHTL